MSIGPAFDDLIRRFHVLSEGNENEFFNYATSAYDHFRRCSDNQKELIRIQKELIKSQSEVNSLQLKLKNTKQLLSTEYNKRLSIEKEKKDLESQILRAVEMSTKPGGQLEALSSTFSSLLNSSRGFKGLAILSPDHLSTINEGLDTLGSLSVIDISDVDMTEGNELESSRHTRSGRSYSNDGRNRSAHKRKSQDRLSEFKNKKQAQDNKENEFLSESKQFLSSKTCSVPSAPLISEHQDDEFNSFFTPIKQRVPIKVTSAGGTEYLHSPVIRNYSSSKVNLRPHSFVTKTIYWVEACQPCGKRIKFGKTAFKCRECRATCHAECKDGVPLPCVNTGSTPGTKGHVNSIADYAPRIPPMVPALVVHCTNHIEKEGLTEVGIYRVPGSERDVKELKERFLRGKGIPNLSQINDIHVICGCLKDFLRSLNEPLITFTQWMDFTDAVEKDGQDIQPALFQCISQLPQPNRDTLAWIISHLQRVAECTETKMPTMNLAKVFGPTIVGYSVAEPEPAAILSQTREQQKVMEKLLDISPEYWATFIELDNTGALQNSHNPMMFSTPEKEVFKTPSRRRSFLMCTPLQQRDKQTPNYRPLH